MNLMGKKLYLKKNLYASDVTRFRKVSSNFFFFGFCSSINFSFLSLMENAYLKGKKNREKKNKKKREKEKKKERVKGINQIALHQLRLI